MNDIEVLVTLWPTFPHFNRFARDTRLSAIRMNTAMVDDATFKQELEHAKSIATVPLYLDFKGRQMRVKEVPEYKPGDDHLELVLNHPIEVKTPVDVIFKGGNDYCTLKEVDGDRLIFDGFPEYGIRVGESICIRDPSLKIGGNLFTDIEKKRIAIAKELGYKKFMLSYVENAQDMYEFRDLVGEDCELIAKIESERGMRFVREEYSPDMGFGLLAARGDLYVELDRPTYMLQAVKDIVDKDPTAIAGSRMLLTLSESSVPEASDISEIAWLYENGYKRLMFCDSLCLTEEALSRGINVIDEMKDVCSTLYK